MLQRFANNKQDYLLPCKAGFLEFIEHSSKAEMLFDFQQQAGSIWGPQAHPGRLCP